MTVSLDALGLQLYYTINTSITRYCAAIHALNGQTDANSNTLSLLRNYPFNETGGANVLDTTGNQNATYIGTPTLGVSGPLYNETYGQGFTSSSATNSYVSCGDYGAIIDHIDAEGITVMFWMKNTETSTRHDLCGAMLGGKNGFEILQNYHGAGQIDLFFAPSAGTAYGNNIVWNLGIDSLGRDPNWHLFEFYISSTAANCQLRIDGALQTVSSSSIASDGGTYTNASNPFYIAASQDSIPTNCNSTFHDCAVFVGKLTERQRSGLLQSALLTVNGVAGIISEWKPTSCLNSSDAPCAEGDYVKTLNDTWGVCNLTQGTSSLRPKYIYARNGNRPAIYFNNRAQSATFGGLKQWMSGSLPTALQQDHYSLLCAFRMPLPLLSNDVSFQAALALGHSTTASGAICQDCSTGKPSMIRGFAAATDSSSSLPAVRLAPGLCVMVLSIGKDGRGNNKIYMNRFSGSVTMAGGTFNQTSELVTLGCNTDLSALAHMYLEHAMISSIPVTADMAASYIAARFADAGETQNPSAHVFIYGDSITCGQNAGNPAVDTTGDAGDMMLQVPWGWRKFASFTRYGRGGARLSGGSPNIAATFDLGNVIYYDTRVGCTNIVLCEAGVNDANSAVSGANMLTGLNAAMAICNAETDKKCALTLSTNASNPGKDAYNALITAQVGVSLNGVGVLGSLAPAGDLDPADNLHPFSAGMLVYANALNRALSQAAPNFFGTGGTFRNRSRNSRPLMGVR